MRSLPFLTGLSAAAVLFACVGDTPILPGVDGSVADSSSRDAAGASDTSATPDGFKCDAPNTVCGTSCVNTQTDDGNCGACAHSCKGDGCDKGICKTVDLLTGLNFPTSIAQNSSFPLVFVSANSRVITCSKTGCGNSPTSVWSGSTYATNATSDVAVGSFSVGAQAYDGASKQWLAYEKAGAATVTDPSVTAATGATLDHLFAFPDDDTFVFQWGYGISLCSSGPFSCGSGATKLDGDNCETAAAVQPGTPGYTAWTTCNNISYCARGSACTPQPLVTFSAQPTVPFMVASSTTLYWVQSISSKFKIFSCPFPAGCTTPTLLVDGESAADGFAADDAGLYWTQATAGLVRACLDTKKGCGTTPLTLAMNLAVPTGIVVDKDNVFWTQKGGGASQGKVTRMTR